MARIRTIKPEFFSSLTVASLPVMTRLTFIGLWTHVDDEGRCVDDARLVKAAVWPLDDRVSADVEEDLQALTESSLITRYKVGDRSYIAVRGWREHQRINRPTPSKFPPPPVAEPTSVQAAALPTATNSTTATHAALPANSPGGNCADALFPESSVSTHAQLSDGSSQERKGTGNREQGTGNTSAAEAAKRGTRIPVNFAPTPDMVAWARSECPLLDLDYETKQFIGHWSSKTGKDATKLDWPTTWKNWLRKSQKEAADRAERERRRAASQSQRSSGQNLHRDRMPEAERNARDPMQAVLAAQSGASR